MYRNRRRLFVVGLILFSLLTLLFLWKETLTTSRPINDSKITNFFLILGAIAAAPTLFFLASQLQEQRRMRLASVIPEIYPSNTRFTLEYHEHDIDGQKGVQPFPVELYSSEVNILSITNIGVGTAKAIKAQWIYDKKEVDRLADGHYSFFPKMATGNRTVINILKPTGDARVNLPLYYLICCGSDLNLKSASSGSDGIFGNKPPLKLQIEYQDIYNITFNHVFNVDVQAYSDLVILKFGDPT